MTQDPTPETSGNSALGAADRQVARAAGGENSSPVTARRFEWVLHIYAVLALAFAAPMYGRLEQQKPYPYLVSLETVSVLIFVFVWSVAVPAGVLLGIAGLQCWSSRAGVIALKSVLGAAVTMILLGVLAQRLYGGGLGWITLMGSIAGGVFAARGYQHWPWLRSLLSLAAVGSLLFPTSLLWVYFRDAARPVVNAELTADNPVPVVMVVFDCFSGVSLLDQNRRIDAQRYPRFAELAATSNWYRNCSSVHPRTVRAVPAILSGSLPPGVHYATVKEYPQNLFTLLKATGKYQLTSFEPFTALCPQDRHRDRVLPNPWTQWKGINATVGAVFLHDLMPADLPFDTPIVPRAWFGLEHPHGADLQQRQGLIRYSWDVGRDEQFHHFMDCIHNPDQPNIWFGHFALPHFPWRYLPSGHLYHADDGIRQVWGTEGSLSEEWADDEQTVLQAHQQHLLQQGYTDRLVGELIDHLRRQDLFDRCLLVIVADHGISFRSGMPGRLPNEKNLADIMSVPLFIKLPGQTIGDVIDLNSETTDVLPTILDVLKLSPPTPLGGQSLISPTFAERPVKMFTDDEHVFEVDGAFEIRYDVLIEQLARFGTGADPLRIFKIGPHPELLGRRIDELTVSGKSPIQIRPLNFQAETDYIPGRLVPVHLEAMIEGQTTLPVRFAIAVNDTVWGTTQTYRASYLQSYWRVMLPEAAILEGANTFRIFQIGDSPQGLTFTECPIGPPGPAPQLPGEF